MKNPETKVEDFIFENSESDYANNNINHNNTEYDKDSNYSSARKDNPHRSKRLILSRRSSNKKIQEINIQNEEILKTDNSNQKVIFPTSRTGNESNPNYLSFSNFNNEENNKDKNSIYKNHKIIIGKNILDSHRLNLMDIVNKNNTIQNNSYTNNSYPIIPKENSYLNNPVNTNNNKIKKNETKFILKKDKNVNVKNITLEENAEKNFDNQNNFEGYLEDNINETSGYENFNNKSASNNLEYKRDNNLLTQRSENFHKKAYEDNFKKSFEHFPNYTTIPKSKFMIKIFFLVNYLNKNTKINNQFLYL